jgi:hypothetical protein
MVPRQRGHCKVRRLVLRKQWSQSSQRTGRTISEQLVHRIEVATPSTISSPRQFGHVTENWGARVRFPIARRRVERDALPETGLPSTGVLLIWMATHEWGLHSHPGYLRVHAVHPAHDAVGTPPAKCIREHVFPSSRSIRFSSAQACASSNARSAVVQLVPQ